MDDHHKEKQDREGTLDPFHQLVLKKFHVFIGVHTEKHEQCTIM